MKKVKACKKCGYTGNSSFCPRCGSLMRYIAYQDEDEIIVEALKGDNVGLTFGFHVNCENGNACVDKKWTTFGKPILVCNCCYLRVEIK